MTDSSRPSIAVCFFGITRCAEVTSPTIHENVLEPLRAIGDVSTYAHLYRQDRIYNPRNGEDAPADNEGWRLLAPDRLILQSPEEANLGMLLDEIKTYGDAFDNGFASTTNLVRQLHSLRSVFELSRKGRYDLWVFVRPDLSYHDSLGPVAATSLKSKSPHVVIPRWQHCNRGYNDRFAICRGTVSADAYANRIDHALSYCQRVGPLHSEKLLKHRLQSRGLPVRLMSSRASRVRVDGQIKPEDFRDWRHREAVRLSLLGGIYVLEKIGIWSLLRPAARRVFGRSTSTR